MSGYIQLENHFFDYWLPKLGHAEIKVFLMILRKTVGWNKPSDKFAMSQIMETTGLSKPSCVQGIKDLVKRGLITAKKTEGQTTEYSINQSTYLTSKETSPDQLSYLTAPVKLLNRTSKETLPLTGKETLPTKDTNKKHYTKNTKQQTPLSAKKLNIPFEQFWDEYDKKVGKRSKIETKWNKLTNQQREAAIKHIPLYKLAQPDKRYRKNPETYLNNEAWNDEIIEANHDHATHQPNYTSNTSANYGAMLDQQKQAYQALANAS